MSEKSYVSLEQAICPVCGTTHDTGVLLDRRLRKSLEPKTVTHWAWCPDCDQKRQAGFVALVEANAAAQTQTMQLEDADRTGKIVFLKADVWARVFNVPVPPKGLCFIEPGVIERLQAMTGPAETDPESEGGGPTP